MPRGGHKVKTPKPSQIETPATPRVSGNASTGTKAVRTNTDWKANLLAPTFRSRNTSDTKIIAAEPNQDDAAHELSCQPDQLLNPAGRDVGSAGMQAVSVEPDRLSQNQEYFSRPTSRAATPESPLINVEEKYEGVLDTFESLTTETTQSSASSSTYSRDSNSIYSRTSSYSRGSSVYSSGTSIYSFDECGLEELDRGTRKAPTQLVTQDTDANLDTRLQGGVQYQRSRNLAVRQSEVLDNASRDRSTLAKKAALFKNSRLRPQLPVFSTSLPTWSMVCRAVRAAQDCYDSHSLTRLGVYTPADSSKDIKAMIVDDQLIDDSRVVIVSIRGTQFQSLSDWTVNGSANPVPPAGFLDDEGNACHAGFLQVTKAMVSQIASQLKQHPAILEQPSLMFTGHSAGGAVAALLYSHMVSTTVKSELTALAGQFPSINCVTFGAPPIAQRPLPRRDHASGVFLSFANEGDPVLRSSNAAYFKSLIKLMTASPQCSITSVPVAPPVKVVRGSRGAAVYRQIVAVAPPPPWEELPIWPTPSASLTNAGEVILLRDDENGSATASSVTAEDLAEVIFGDLAQHTVQMYIRRIKDVALLAMMGRN